MATDSAARTDRQAMESATSDRAKDYNLVVFQRRKPCGENHPTLKVRREIPLSAGNFPVIPTAHHQGGRADPGETCASARCPQRGRLFVVISTGAVVGTGEGNSLGSHAGDLRSETYLQLGTSKNL